MPLRRRLRWLTPYLFLIPGGLWLIVFFVAPMIVMASVSLQEGSLATGYRLTWNFAVYGQVINEYLPQFWRSGIYALSVTLLALLFGYPMAYTIAFRGGRAKNILLLLVILPFFTAFIIRTLSWKLILADNGFVLGTLKSFGLLDQGFHVLASPIAVISGLTYNFLPFMVLPVYVALEKIDPHLVEAANDLYASRLQAFLRVTLPLSMPGIFAGSLLVFIPACGEFVIPELLGGPSAQLVGRVLWTEFFQNRDWPLASALAVAMLVLLVLPIAIFQRRAAKA